MKNCIFINFKDELKAFPIEESGGSYAFYEEVLKIAKQLHFDKELADGEFTTIVNNEIIFTDDDCVIMHTPVKEFENENSPDGPMADISDAMSDILADFKKRNRFDLDLRIHYADSGFIANDGFVSRYFPFSEWESFLAMGLEDSDLIAEGEDNGLSYSIFTSEHLQSETADIDPVAKQRVIKFLLDREGN